MRTAQTVLTVIQERGKQHKPIERVYKLLFNRDFYLNAYAKLYPNNGAMTKGVTDETVDGMSIQKIDRMIELLREEKYQWKPARREYIPKKNGKKRPLGIPTWGDKLLQEVMREILEAYYEPQFSNHSHGFRPNRGCHTALQEIQIWKGTRWFIEGTVLTVPRFYAGCHNKFIQKPAVYFGSPGGELSAQRTEGWLPTQGLKIIRIYVRLPAWSGSPRPTLQIYHSPQISNLSSSPIPNFSFLIPN